jgi:hypothetical protein
MTGWLIALALARGLDAGTTLVGISRGGRETIAWMPEHPVFVVSVQAGATAGQALLLTRLHRTHPKLATGLAVVAVAVEGSVVARNVQQLRSNR